MTMYPMLESDDIDPLATIWAIIEAKPTIPRLIAVVSATDLDDTEQIARGLASAAQDAGNRTGYLYLGPDRRAPRDNFATYTDLTIAGRLFSRERFDSWLQVWHKSYDIIIVELPQLLTCQLGAHVARLAGGIIVGVFPDRRVSNFDRELTALFGQLQASIIGVVKTPATPSIVSASNVPAKSLASRLFPVRQP